MDSNFYMQKRLTLQEVLDEIEAWSDDEAPTVTQHTIVITPPEDGNETEQDSGAEDCANYNNVGPKLLQAETFLDERNHYELDNNIEENSSTTELQTKPTERKWIKGDIQDITSIQCSEWESRPPPLALSNESHPLDFFMLFFTKELMEDLLKYSVSYAASRNRSFCSSIDEFYAFIGILIISGYSPVSRRRLYWSNELDTKNALISNTMRRNKFDEIMSNFHACDNSNLPQNDKMGKIRPLINHMNQVFPKYCPIERDVSIDESMIPYFGRHGCKMFIKGKPIRFGFKAWVLATKSGYCVNFDIYQGKSMEAAIPENSYGKGESVIIQFQQILQDKFPDLQFSLYFDNYFTSPRLISYLGKHNFGGTGTVRANRVGKTSTLKDAKQFKKLKRGVYDSMVDKNENIVGVRWNDNSVVTVLSNQYGILPLKKANRYSASEKKKVEIPQPHVVWAYNQRMGGVDLLDNNVSNYRIGIRGKKWYIPIEFWLFDIAITNAWVLSKSFGANLDQLEFRRQIARALCALYGTPALAPGPRPRQFKTNPILKLGRHLVIKINSRRKCAQCHTRATTACSTCDIPLHNKCFVAYHQ